MLVTGKDEYVLGEASTRRRGRRESPVFPLPAGLSATVQDIRSGSRDYQTLYRARNRIRSNLPATPVPHD